MILKFIAPVPSHYPPSPPPNHTHACMHAHIHVYMHAHIHVIVHMCTGIHACMHPCTVNEASAIIAAPLQGRFEHVGARFSATCVAYGSPRPQVWFGSEALGISNFNNEADPMINVYTEDVVVQGYLFVAATLELCGSDSDVEFYERYLTEYECYTSNGAVSNPPIGVQLVEFTIQPSRKSSIMCMHNYNYSIRIASGNHSDYSSLYSSY